MEDKFIKIDDDLKELLSKKGDANAYVNDCIRENINKKTVQTTNDNARHISSEQQSGCIGGKVLLGTVLGIIVASILIFAYKHVASYDDSYSGNINNESTSVGSDDDGVTDSQAQITAEDMVKQDVLSADDLEFHAIGVDKCGTNEYHVVANIKTLNGMGLLVPRKVSVRLKYNGGDWTDISNWTQISIKYLDESTGREQ